MSEALKYLQPEVVSKLSTMELRARLVVEGFIAGLHKSPYHGFSVEFAEHRQYMAGDEIKHIDWKVYGKTDRYYIKQFEEETNLKSYLILDASSSMAFASPLVPGKTEKRISKLEYACYLTAALSYLMVQQRDAVGLTIYSDTIRSSIPPHATNAYLKRILTELEGLTANDTTRTAPALHRIAETITRRGLVIIMSDLFDDPDSVIAALKHFRHNRHEVIVFHILDPYERTFDFGADAQFKDMETGDQLVSQPYHILRSYQKQMNAFIDRYKRECREHRVDYVLLDTSMTFDTALFQYLNKRKRVG
jgi:uncharacterized protein (DUF58 family)